MNVNKCCIYSKLEIALIQCFIIKFMIDFQQKNYSLRNCINRASLLKKSIIHFVIQFERTFSNIIHSFVTDRNSSVKQMPPKKKEEAKPKPLIGRVGTNLKMGIVGLPNAGLV